MNEMRTLTARFRMRLNCNILHRHLKHLDVIKIQTKWHCEVSACIEKRTMAMWFRFDRSNFTSKLQVQHTLKTFSSNSRSKKAHANKLGNTIAHLLSYLRTLSFHSTTRGRMSLSVVRFRLTLRRRKLGRLDF